jgi:hypothetical protein
MKNTIKTVLLLTAVTLTSVQWLLASDVTGDRLKIGDSNGATQTLDDAHDSIAGGDDNSILDTESGWDYNFIAGGEGNVISNGVYCSIGGGTGNTLAPYLQWATIAGGYANTINGYNGSDASVISGGGENTITGTDWDQYSVIAGGLRSLIDGRGYSFIGGGAFHRIGPPGYYSVIAGGYYNTNTALIGTIAGGDGNLVTGDCAAALGGIYSEARLAGQFAHGGGNFGTSPERGANQASEYIAHAITTNSTNTELLLQGIFATQRVLLPSNGSWSFDVQVVVRSVNGDTAGFKGDGVIKNVSGTPTLVGTGGSITLNPTYADASLSGTTVVVSADGTYDALGISVNGNASTNRWVATLRTTEVKY